MWPSSFLCDHNFATKVVYRVAALVRLSAKDQISFEGHPGPGEATVVIWRHSRIFEDAPKALMGAQVPQISNTCPDAAEALTLSQKQDNVANVSAPTPGARKDSPKAP